MITPKYLIDSFLESSVTLVPEKRDNIWASDIGKPMIERYLEMKGTPFTNPMEAQAISNFIIGKSAETGYKDLLKLCMLPYEDRESISIKLPGCLELTGKPDVILEVKDWSVIYDKIDAYLGDDLKPERKKEQKRKLSSMLDKFKAKYPAGIPKMVSEIKTLSHAAAIYSKSVKKSFIELYPQYVLQLYSYIHALDLQEGYLIFIVKEMGKGQGWVHEFKIERSDELFNKLKTDIETISKYYLTDTVPPKEPLMDGKRVNFWARYSKYWDMLYKEDFEKSLGGETK